MTNIQNTTHDPHGIVGSVIAGRYRVLQILGTGSFAIVYLAIDTLSRKKVAVKCLAKTFSSQTKQSDQDRLNAQLREIAIMKRLQPHPYIVSLYDCIQVDKFIFLIMEHCEMDLYEAITQKGGFPEDVVREVFLQLVDALIHCHSLGIYHRDIKPENCLISPEYTLKLTDFGLSTSDKWSFEFGCGSVRYMAPECLAVDPDTGKGYSPALNDVWSLGIILINLLFGKNPWHEASLSDPLYSMYVSKNPNILREQFGLTNEFNAVLSAIFQRDPARRANMHQLRDYIQSLPFFTVRQQQSRQQKLQSNTIISSNRRPQMLGKKQTEPQHSTLSSTLSCHDGDSSNTSFMSFEDRRHQLQNTAYSTRSSQRTEIIGHTSLHSNHIVSSLSATGAALPDADLFAPEEIDSCNNLSNASDMFYIFKYDHNNHQYNSSQHRHFTSITPSTEAVQSSRRAMDVDQTEREHNSQATSQPMLTVTISHAASCFSDIANAADEAYMEKNMFLARTPITPKDCLHQFPPAFRDSAIALEDGHIADQQGCSAAAQIAIDVGEQSLFSNIMVDDSTVKLMSKQKNPVHVQDKSVKRRGGDAGNGRRQRRLTGDGGYLSMLLPSSWIAATGATNLLPSTH